MNLLIDIGNTSAKVAIMDGDTLLHTEHKNSPWDSLFRRLQASYPIEHIVISTVTAEDKELEATLRSLPQPVLWLTADTPCQLKNVPPGYGADRLAADLGAIAQSPGHTLLVIDAGTCITYDLISRQGEILSGVISPGIQLRLRAMHEHTALLPLFQAEPDTPLMGHDTKSSMMSSAIHGTRFEIEGYIRSLLPAYPDLRVFLTGGNTFQLSADLQERTLHDPHLLFRGLQSLT
ncbi:MAG: type III pantothenate kinase [Bacteroidaceae bacterium]|nr:type III pantothenate kinase [Bacteroidaceae bacterium]